MRIIAKQPDFYDHAMAFGIDPKAVYHRVPESVRMDTLPKPVSKALGVKSVNLEPFSWRSRDKNYEIHRVAAIIGGVLRIAYFEMIPFTPTKSLMQQVDMRPMKDRFRFFRSLDDLLAGRKIHKPMWQRPEFDDFPLDDGSLEYRDLAIELNAPVMVFGVDFAYAYASGNDTYNSPRTPTGMITKVDWNKNTFVKNAPILGMMGLGGIMDATQIFMDISNFVLTMNEKPMAQITNSDKITKAGFDKIVSFRHRDK